MSSKNKKSEFHNTITFTIPAEILTPSANNTILKIFLYVKLISLNRAPNKIQKETASILIINNNGIIKYPAQTHFAFR